MALRHARPVAALFLLSLAAAATAQAPAAQPAPPAPAANAAGPAQATPPSAGEEIVVTGVLPLVVDIEEVAQRCAACRRALARLQGAATAAATPATRRRPAPEALGESRAQPNLGFNRPMDTTTASARGMMAYTETHTRAAITSRRTLDRPRQPDLEAMADRYFQNLLSYVGPIVDREIQARRAPAAYAADDPATRGLSTTDITDAVIEHLDRDHPGVDLLAGPRPS